jgi:hypothetical protein
VVGGNDPEIDDELAGSSDVYGFLPDFLAVLDNVSTRLPASACSSRTATRPGSER